MSSVNSSPGVMHGESRNMYGKGIDLIYCNGIALLSSWLHCLRLLQLLHVVTANVVNVVKLVGNSEICKYRDLCPSRPASNTE